MSNPVNCLYVTEQGAYLRLDHENVVVSVEHEARLRIPFTAISGIVCFGRVSASPELMAHCAELGIGFAFLALSGRFLCRVEGKVSGNVLLRRAQFRAAENEERSVALARSIVAAKLQSSRTLIRRVLADHGDKIRSDRCEGSILSIEGLVRGVSSAETMDELRGIEGAGANAYFAIFDEMILVEDSLFRFEKRSRRPPLNRTNALLSFVYTLVEHEVASALSAVGLDYQVGFLHEDRPGRRSLALDLMEELRSCFADRLVLSVINRRQITADDFLMRDNGAIEMKDDARKKLIVEYQKKKTETLKHPLTGEETCWGLIPHVQARLFARTLRDDLPDYPAFVWR